jgi:hypothetical protein
MIYSLSSLKDKIVKNLKIQIIKSNEPDLQNNLYRWGIALKEIFVKNGPWGSFILYSNEQEIAISPLLAKDLKVQIV